MRSLIWATTLAMELNSDIFSQEIKKGWVDRYVPQDLWQTDWDHPIPPQKTHFQHHTWSYGCWDGCSWDRHLLPLSSSPPVPYETSTAWVQYGAGENARYPIPSSPWSHRVKRGDCRCCVFNKTPVTKGANAQACQILPSQMWWVRWVRMLCNSLTALTLRL